MGRPFGWSFKLRCRINEFLDCGWLILDIAKGWDLGAAF
jgi:hypothetical protein